MEKLDKKARLLIALTESFGYKLTYTNAIKVLYTLDKRYYCSTKIHAIRDLRHLATDPGTDDTIGLKDSKRIFDTLETRYA